MKVLTVEQYTCLLSDRITEVDDSMSACDDFCVKDFFEHLGNFKEDMILVYSHTLDSTQTFMMQHCQGLQNIVCTTDIQTNGKGELLHTHIITRSQIECMVIA